MNGETPDAGRSAPVPQGRPGFALGEKQKSVLWLLGAGAVVSLVFWQNPPGGDPPMPESRQEDIRRVADTGEYRRPPAPAEGPQPPAQTQGGGPPLPPANGSFLPQEGVAQGGEGAKNRRMLSFATSAPAAQPTQGGAASPAGGASGSPPSGSQSGPTTVAFGGTSIPGKRAGAAIDTSLTLMPGIYACVLETAVDSERPGPFFCEVTRPIKAPSGVPLLPRGTRIVGTYSNEVGQGQGRIASLAAVAWTPEGVPVPLGAQAGDALGRTGLTGDVDTKFWPRMQSAVLLLLTRGAMQTAQTALQAALSKSGTTNLNISGGGIEQAVAESLRGTQSIQNAVTIHQGTEISFMVTEPISFSDAYRLAPR